MTILPEASLISTFCATCPFPATVKALRQHLLSLPISASWRPWIFWQKEEDHHDLVERIETRHGHRQLSYMKELGMGNDKYVLIDLDNGECRIQPKDAVTHVVPFEG